MRSSGVRRLKTESAHWLARGVGTRKDGGCAGACARLKNDRQVSKTASVIDRDVANEKGMTIDSQKYGNECQNTTRVPIQLGGETLASRPIQLD